MILTSVRIDENGNEISSFQYFEETEKHWWEKLIDWFKNSNVTPYLEIKDLNNGPDTNDENKPKTAGEIGIEIKF